MYMYTCSLIYGLLLKLTGLNKMTRHGLTKLSNGVTGHRHKQYIVHPTYLYCTTEQRQLESLCRPNGLQALIRICAGPDVPAPVLVSQRVAISRTMDINCRSMANRVLRKLAINRKAF